MRIAAPSVARFATLLLACLLTVLACDSRPTYSGNPPTVWLNYSTREIDLVLVDYEPPPF